MEMKKTILAVDDSQSIRHLVSSTLSDNGYEVVVAEDGEEAYKLLDGRTIDLVLTDLHMPKMNGIELTAKIRSTEQYKFVPILLLTSESKAEMKSKAKEAGATGWIVKPFVEEKLLGAIRKVMR